jgi:type IV secretion system protein VirB10
MNTPNDGREPSETTASARTDEGVSPGIVGERHIPSVNRIRSLQSRVSTLLAIVVMCALGAGLLGWYYTHAFERERGSATSTKQRAQGEPFLPELGAIPRKESAESPPDPVARLLGPTPELATAPDHSRAQHSARRPVANDSARPKRPARPLTGPVLARVSRTGGSMPSGASPGGPLSMQEAVSDIGADRGGEPSNSLAGLLQENRRSAGLAALLPTLRYLLAEGTTIDCSLETAIDSSLPGLVRCITATDVWSADGTVVLIEKGSQLVGETRAQLRQGMSRVFVLWTRARTPLGVVIPLASPGTDSLGRSGVAGEVDRHFFERFGAAILISVIDGAIQAAASSGSGDGDTVVLNSSSSRDILTEVLRSTVSIPPTVKVPQGERVQIIAARDLDFRGVYELRPYRNAAR